MNKWIDKGKRAYHFNEIDIFSLPEFLNKIRPLFSAAVVGLMRAHDLLAGMQSTL